jgi:CheY-like chemotaxis protein
MTGVLLLCDDMLFASRIEATARSLEIPLRTCRHAHTALDLAKKDPPNCVLIDLANPGLAIADFVADLGQRSAPAPFVAAFGSHVDTDSLREARAAGCDVVWPRSKFAEDLERALPAWAMGQEL